MAPSTPKRPSSRSSAAEPPSAQRKKPALPFDDDEMPSKDEIRASRLEAARRRLAAPEPPTDEHDSPMDADDRRVTVPEAPGAKVAKEQKFSEAFLYVERGPGAGQAAPVGQGLLFIGRASTSGLRIQHPSVSRRHAQLTRNGERFFIRDLASQNGTFVNQAKIDKEVEIFPGDELVMGTAQLRLRGAGGTGTRTRATSGKSGKGSNATAIIATALVSAAVVAAVMFFLLRSRGPSYEDLGEAKGGDKPVVVKAPVEDKPVPPQPQQVATEQKPAPVTPAEPKADATKPDSTAATTPPAVAETKKAEDAQATQPTEPAHPAKVEKKTATKPPASASRGGKKAAGQKDDDDAPGPSAPRGDPTVLARFETGNVGAAIDLAKKKGAKELLAKLTKFQTLYDAGQRALTAHDEASALKNLDGALKTAESLSGGWDKYSNDLRHQLSALHMMAGTKLLPKDPGGARKELNIALQYDPDNAKAKEQLGKLDPSAAPPKAADPKTTGKKAAIDEAFGN